ncbi:hypothetical protein HPG69_016063 [Diceros bicornis minor]|uniref:Uncharacterized protein n=1 Tax=Diceros bicornis minor TaxID=77932 RepID=A0A7J7FDJ0_DICBM|nr:hypothetical protein HPG69_016063 [Diceros bicornis minor]
MMVYEVNVWLDEGLSDSRLHLKGHLDWIPSILKCTTNAVVCPAIVTDMVSSFFSYELTYKLQLPRFGAPREAVDARLEMKRCTDKISFRNRLLILKALASDQVNIQGGGGVLLLGGTGGGGTCLTAHL